MGVFAHVRSDTKPLKDHIPGYKHTTVSSGFLIARVFSRSRLFVAPNKHDSVIRSWVNICVEIMRLPRVVVASARGAAGDGASALTRVPYLC